MNLTGVKAIGTIMANSISVKRNLLSSSIAQKSENVLLKVIDINIDTLNVEVNCFINAMRKDKKQTSNSLTAILLRNDDLSNIQLKIVHDIEIEEVSYAIKYFQDLYKNM